MAVLNIVWNLLSSILVLLLGIIYFKEKISWIKIIALGMGLCSLGLLTIDYF
jgi:drug/metabolite transporter (DMT)-like permease